jgi:hypothetical protein
MLGAAMNKFVKKMGCTERMTNCPFAIFSRNYKKDQKRSKKIIKDPLKKIKNAPPVFSKT